MANYIFSYDLNGSHPTHAEMDKHIEESGWTSGLILETVWYIGTSDSSSAVVQYVTSILSDDDSYIVVTADFMEFDNLLIDGESLKGAWASH